MHGGFDDVRPGVLPTNEAIAVDDALEALIGSDFASELQPAVSYRAGRRIGEGGMAVAFHAIRIAPGTQTPTVLKVLRPPIVRGSATAARLIIQKEAVALGRLNEQVPPNPYVVRLVDVGALQARYEGRPLELPWIALEYVRGGPEGTTLRARVESCIRVTGHAFDAWRSAHAIDAVTRGLHAVHSVAVIHRDVKPDNVLCCGFGDAEIFKVADFGIARPSGMAATFGGLLMGTPGYAPPELAAFDARAIGVWSDVFSLACVVFFILTGEEYFDASEPADALRAARRESRRSVLEARALDPELRANAALCTAIDRALARATSPAPNHRPQSVGELAQEVLPWLRGDARRPAPSPRQVELVELYDDAQTRVDRWRWIVRREPVDDLVVRSVAWDADGHCLAATNHGLSLWDGTEWLRVPMDDFPLDGVRFVTRMSGEHWLAGGDGGRLAIIGRDLTTETLQVTDDSRVIERSVGDLDELAVVVTSGASGAPALHALVGRRWLKPLPLATVAHVTGIAASGDAEFLVCGRLADASGFVARYLPLSWEVHTLDTPRTRSFLTCAASIEHRIGIAAGTDGSVVRYAEGVVTSDRVAPAVDFTASAIDPAAGAWLGSAGKILMRKGDGARCRWRAVFEDRELRAPIISLIADGTRVFATTADGAIVEGVFG